MLYQRDKDFGWLITFASFLIFLLAAIISSAFDALPTGVPEAVALANAHLGRAFVAVTASFIRYVALVGVVYGVIGIVTWPPGNG